MSVIATVLWVLLALCYRLYITTGYTFWTLLSRPSEAVPGLHSSRRKYSRLIVEQELRTYIKVFDLVGEKSEDLYKNIITRFHIVWREAHDWSQACGLTDRIICLSDQSQRSSLSYWSMVAQKLAKSRNLHDWDRQKNSVLVNRSHSRTKETRVGTE